MIVDVVTAKRVSKVANETLYDGDDLILSHSFVPFEEHSSITGNLSLGGESPVGSSGGGVGAARCTAITSSSAQATATANRNVVIPTTTTTIQSRHDDEERCDGTSTKRVDSNNRRDTDVDDGVTSVGSSSSSRSGSDNGQDPTTTSVVHQKNALSSNDRPKQRRPRFSPLRPLRAKLQQKFKSRRRSSAPADLSTMRKESKSETIPEGQEPSSTSSRLTISTNENNTNNSSQHAIPNLEATKDNNSNNMPSPSNQSFRSHRLDVVSGRSLLQRQKAEVFGRPSCAQKEWDLASVARSGDLSSSSPTSSADDQSKRRCRLRLDKCCDWSQVSRLTNDGMKMALTPTKMAHKPPSDGNTIIPFMDVTTEFSAQQRKTPARMLGTRDEALNQQLETVHSGMTEGSSSDSIGNDDSDGDNENIIPKDGAEIRNFRAPSSRATFEKATSCTVASSSCSVMIEPEESWTDLLAEDMLHAVREQEIVPKELLLLSARLSSARVLDAATPAGSRPLVHSDSQLSLQQHDLNPRLGQPNHSNYQSQRTRGGDDEDEPSNSKHLPWNAWLTSIAGGALRRGRIASLEFDKDQSPGPRMLPRCRTSSESDLTRYSTVTKQKEKEQPTQLPTSLSQEMNFQFSASSEEEEDNNDGNASFQEDPSDDDSTTMDNSLVVPQPRRRDRTRSADSTPSKTNNNATRVVYRVDPSFRYTNIDDDDDNSELTELLTALEQASLLSNTKKQRRKKHKRQKSSDNDALKTAESELNGLVRPEPKSRNCHNLSAPSNQSRRLSGSGLSATSSISTIKTRPAGHAHMYAPATNDNNSVASGSTGSNSNSGRQLTIDTGNANPETDTFGQEIRLLSPTAIARGDINYDMDDQSVVSSMLPSTRAAAEEAASVFLGSSPKSALGAAKQMATDANSVVYAAKLPLTVNMAATGQNHRDIYNYYWNNADDDRYENNTKDERQCRSAFDDDDDDLFDGLEDEEHRDEMDEQNVSEVSKSCSSPDKSAVSALDSYV